MAGEAVEKYAYSERRGFVEGGERVRQDCGGSLHCTGQTISAIPEAYENTHVYRQNLSSQLTVDHNLHHDFPKALVSSASHLLQNAAEGEACHTQDSNRKYHPEWCVELGRIKHSDVQSELAEESSVHPWFTPKAV